ncbi:MAG: serine/threonine protein kinase [Betaproteobacteria bacterium]|nr:MAG: serine/threonine protein kinase [Betaproteobacteria bacterium]
MIALIDLFHVSRSIAVILAGRNSSAEVVSAIARLRRVGRRALPKIIPALPDDPHGEPLTNLLAELITTASLPMVVDLGLMNQDPQVVARVRAALARGGKYDPNRLVELYSAAGGAMVNLSEVFLARRDAITPKTVLRILDSAHKDNQPTLFKIVGELTTEAMVASLIGFSRNAEWEARYCIVQAISRFSTEPVRDTLLRFIKDPHKLVRQAAVEGLAGLTIPVPAAPIAALLRDPDLMVQTRAIETMIKLNDPSSVRDLLTILQDESEHARRAAVEVLNAIGDASAIKDLLHAMKDQDWWVRVRAADALGAIGGPKVIDAVLALLGDGDEFMRRCAVEILNTTKDPRAFDKLIAALGDPDWWVRERALDALANMRDPRALPAITKFLDTDNEATPVAIRALAAIGDTRAALAIARKLDSNDEAIVREALGALEALTDAKSAEAVLAALAQLSERPVAAEIAQAAVKAHGTISARVRGRPRTPSSDPRVELPLRSGRTVMLQTVARPLSDPSSPASVPPAPQPKVAAVNASNASGDESLDIHKLVPGQVIGGRYQVKREIGRGGFGVVMLVEDQMVHEDIALKLISPHLTEDETAIMRMVHEVRYARKITHENVIRIHDFLNIGRTYAMSMEYFASVPLTRKIRRGLNLPKQEALRLLRDILRGTLVAHNAGIVHRDLKPANILINNEGLVKIVDFGLAAAMSHSNSRVTKTGHLVGTPNYMAPEQVRGQPIDQRTDLYALGVIMYEMFTGVPPYVSDNPMGILYQHLEGKKVAPSEHNPEVSPALEAVILKAMAVEPEARYQSAAQMLEDLEALMIREAA